MNQMPKKSCRGSEHSSLPMNDPLIDQEYLLSIFDYNPDTGDLIRKVRTGPNSKVGDKAGFQDRKDGYVEVKVRGRRYLAHRVIWMMVHGRWPYPQLDHIDRNPSNNKLSNLREVTKMQNMCNRGRPMNSARPYRGVDVIQCKLKNRYSAKINAMKRSYYLGTFDCPIAAAKAYDRAAKEKFGDFAQPNFPDDQAGEVA